MKKSILDLVIEEWLKAVPSESLLKTGDLIFRHGRGFMSNSFMLFSRKDKRYSHSGIISIQHGEVYVYHAIGGEENKTNPLRKETLADFCNPDNIHSFGIYRLSLSPEQLKKEDSLARHYYKKRLEFDTDFDLATNDKMYCTEFVYKVLQEATGNKNYISSCSVSGKNYVACDDLYLNPHASKVYSYVY